VTHRPQSRILRCNTTAILFFIAGMVLGFQANSLISSSHHIGIIKDLEKCQSSLQKDEPSSRQDQSKTTVIAQTSNADTVKVSADEFHSHFEYGFPTPRETDEKDDANEVLFMTKPISNNSMAVPLLSVDDATSTCTDVIAIYVKELNGGSQPCIALVGSSSGTHHLLRYKRKGPTFERVGMKGRFMRAPPESAIIQHQKNILSLFTHLDEALDELRPILERIHRDKAVVVMCINQGYLPLLMNFVCESRRNGVDLSSVLVFATDEETHKIAMMLGLTTYYSEKLLGNVPTKRAKNLGDKTFALATFAGSISVFLVNSLGYDVLFQDADVVNFRNPLDFFQKTEWTRRYDVLFMDDGNSNWEYQPFRANQGFYFVRYNDRTRHLMNSYIFNGVLVATSGIDQIVMSLLLNEHSAFHGLNVKTLDWKDFPGGREFRTNKNYMKELSDGNRTPWIFHMHWTANLDDKIKFFRQSHMWSTNSDCLETDPPSHIKEDGSWADHCCSLLPIQ